MFTNKTTLRHAYKMDLATLPYNAHTQDPRTNLQPPQPFQEKPRDAQREVQQCGGWKILDATTQKSGDLGASQIP